MKFTRDEYLEIMTFGTPPRPMFVELFGPLVGLEDQWRSQGATEDEVNLTAFDWDWVPRVGAPVNTGMRGGLEPMVLEETDAYRIERDALGRTKKLIKGVATIALPLDFPVTDMDSWLKLKPMFTWHEDRVDLSAIDEVKRKQAEGHMVVAHIPGGFDLPRQLLGEERVCLCYYENPELMHDIMATLTDTALKALERVSEQVTIDQLSVHEDMAGKSGPLIGPAQINEFVAPYFSQVWQLVSSRGTRLFEMDSDGNMNPVIDTYLDCGLTAMHPMEPAAGMDVVALRKIYGTRLAMKGGIDKHVLRRTKREIREELEYKMQPMMRDGGLVFGLDHRIPGGTPIENYRYYVKLGREILGREPVSGKGWDRMAF